MQVKLRKCERDNLKWVVERAYRESQEQGKDIYIMLNLADKKNRMCFGPCPHAGYLIIGKIVRHDIEGTEVFTAYMFWPLICPEVPHGPEHAGGRYTEFGRLLCESVPIEVW